MFVRERQTDRWRGRMLLQPDSGFKPQLGATYSAASCMQKTKVLCVSGLEGKRVSGQVHVCVCVRERRDGQREEKRDRQTDVQGCCWVPYLLSHSLPAEDHSCVCVCGCVHACMLLVCGCLCVCVCACMHVCVRVCVLSLIHI